MLELPRAGMQLSVERHNVELDALCDWLEASALFDEEEPSRSEVVDILIENTIYRRQDFAMEMVQNAWGELERRQSWAGRGAAIEVFGQRLRPLGAWQDWPAHSFCLALACARLYPDWRSQFGPDYTQQGDLFESLTKESLERILPGWRAHRTGWTPTRPIGLAAAAADVASRLGEQLGDVGYWGSRGAHEEGLDILCYRSLEDDRVGTPAYMIQCASGTNWRDKLGTPDLNVWTTIVTFASKPKRGFSMPFTLSNDRDFARSCLRVDGMLLDRNRLLAAGRIDPDWVSTRLTNLLIDWLGPRVNALPRMDR